ncbi:hypothetical protein D5H75_25540 [Bailinhaonella thermotolerans]|uniref:DUF6817 domain-containing protein n=1 Tax=Bailinhaonella thermotolerans TaxID=1070861 RepID=A0A3A4AN81_9ACTN|nr:hypothetical protein D5H75_25540 [Bailinhaonella thermotolerans]
MAARGAEETPHPGGTLLGHLRRVAALLGRWGAPPAVRLAGLAHAWYGTDGFPVALGDPARRGELAEAAGEEAESLVYLYGACDRAFTYPRLTGDGAVRDRFTGGVLRPGPRDLRALAEITVANELDLAAADPAFRAEHGPALRALFTSWARLLTPQARRAARDALPEAPVP